jgi:hypothetical protein
MYSNENVLPVKNPLWDLFQSLEISRTGSLETIPFQIEQRFLIEGNCSHSSKMGCDGFPHQITMHLSSKNDRRYRSSFEARAIKKDLWQLYTGARTYYYDTEGIFVTD